METFIKTSALDTYFTTEALQKPADVFKKVHTPIDRIGVDFYRDGTHGKFATEEQVADWVLDSRGSQWNNRIFTITGETGSGKSEMCQYIRYRAEETKGHVPILISRSMTRLRDIVSLLHQHLGQAEPEDIGEITALPAETIRQVAVGECMLALETKSFQKYTSDQRQALRQKLQDVAFGRLIERAFARYQRDVKRNGQERVLELMDFDEFESLMSGAAPWLNRKEAFPVLRAHVNEGMKRLVKLSDLGNRLRSIAEHYRDQGKRPVLIMEDLTSFGFVKDDLLDYIFDLNAGNFDVVIGWTTGFEAEQLFNNPNEQLRSYMIDRMRGRFLTTNQETRGAYFLERLHLPMVQRYMDAVREPAAAGKIPDPFYPLNPHAVTRIYQQLLDKGQSKRTPRLLMDTIGTILRSGAAPWREIEERLLGTFLQDWALNDRLFALKDQYPDAVAIAKWYGRPDDSKVDRRTVGLLGVEWPQELADLLSDEPVWAEQAPAAPAADSKAGPDTGKAAGGDSGEQSPPPDAPAKPAPAPAQAGNAPTTAPTAAPKPVVDHDILELQQWMDGRDYPSRQKLKNGLGYLADLIDDHRSIGNPRGQLSTLRFEKTQLHILMDGTNDMVAMPDFPAIRLAPRREEYDFYRHCIKIDKAAAAESALTENPRLAAWVAGLVAEYRRRQRQYLEARLGMPIELFAFHAQVLIKGMNDGITDITARSFLAAGVLPEALLERSGGLKNLAYLKNLMRLRYTMVNLFQSFFYINTTSADQVAAARVIADYDFDRVTDLLNRYSKQIDVGFKVSVANQDAGQGREKALHELVLLVRAACGEVRSAVHNLQPERDKLASIAELADFTSGLTATHLRQQVEMLRSVAAGQKLMERPNWAPLKAIDTSVSFNEIAGTLAGMASRVRLMKNAFEAIALHRAARALEADSNYGLLLAVQDMLHEVSEALRTASSSRHLPGAQSRIVQEDRDDCAEMYAKLSAALEG